MGIPVPELYEALVGLFQRATGPIKYKEGGRSKNGYSPSSFSLLTIGHDGYPMRVVYIPEGRTSGEGFEVDAAFKLEIGNMQHAFVTRDKNLFVLKPPYMQPHNANKSKSEDYTPEVLSAITAAMQKAYPYPPTDEEGKSIHYRLVDDRHQTIALINWYIDYKNYQMHTTVYTAQGAQLPPQLVRASPEVCQQLLRKGNLRLIDSRYLAFQHEGDEPGYAIWSGESAGWSHLVFGFAGEGDKVPSFPDRSTQISWVRQARSLDLDPKRKPPNLKVLH